MVGVKGVFGGGGAGREAQDGSESMTSARAIDIITEALPIFTLTRYPLPQLHANLKSQRGGCRMAVFKNFLYHDSFPYCTFLFPLTPVFCGGGGGG
jgi:hypothetical protein